LLFACKFNSFPLFSSFSLFTLLLFLACHHLSFEIEIVDDFLNKCMFCKLHKKKQHGKIECNEKKMITWKKYNTGGKGYKIGAVDREAGEIEGNEYADDYCGSYDECFCLFQKIG
jgi:hypothetical protein